MISESYTKRKKALASWAAASFVCMLLIFLASSQVAEDSAQLSGGLTRVSFGALWRWFAPDGHEMPEPLFAAFETLVRKAAHILAFLLLGVCAANTVRHAALCRVAASGECESGEATRSGSAGGEIAHGRVVSGKRIFWISLIWCSAYGALDELHQYFVPGRAMMWQDWIIDVIGSLIGIGLVFLVHRKKGNYSQKIINE